MPIAEYACVCLCMPIAEYACVCLCMPVYTYTGIHMVYTEAYTGIYAGIRKHYVDIHMQIYTCRHTQAYTSIHKHTQACTGIHLAYTGMRTVA